MKAVRFLCCGMSRDGEQSSRKDRKSRRRLLSRSDLATDLDFAGLEEHR